MINNLNYYNVFYMVAKTGSISRAANQLYISQPAVSKAPFPVTTPPVKIAFGALRRACRGKAPPSANADRSAA